MALQRLTGPHAKYTQDRWHQIQKEALGTERMLRKQNTNVARYTQDRMAAAGTIYNSRPVEQHVLRPRSRFCSHHSSSNLDTLVSATATLDSGGLQQTLGSSSTSSRPRQASVAMSGTAGRATFPEFKTAWSSDLQAASLRTAVEREDVRGAALAGLLRPEAVSSPKVGSRLDSSSLLRSGLSRSDSSATLSSKSAETASATLSPKSPSGDLNNLSLSRAGSAPWALGSPMRQHEVAAARQGLVPSTDFRGSGRVFTLVIS